MSAHHVIVYQEPGRFCGMPANNGVWLWEDEILVGFALGYYKEATQGHSRTKDPTQRVFARSLDGGETWGLECPAAFANRADNPTIPDSGIDFAHPDFALRCRGNTFHISYDRGKTWLGPSLLPIDIPDLTSRTDYVVNGKDDCHIFLSANDEKVKGYYHDRAFCARTTDGGRTLECLGWMTEPVSIRSVMPSTVRVSDRPVLVSAMRRRRDESDGNHNWIDVYHSTNNGVTWEFLSKVADTDGGEHNGNPPSMVRMTDGRLVVTYGYRAEPYGIRAKVSGDDGKTWGDEIHLRDDARTWDFGYTRTVQRADGKLVTMYYYTTNENREQHISATIWKVPEQ